MRDRSIGIVSGLAAVGLAASVLGVGATVVTGADGSGGRTGSAAAGGTASPSPAATPMDIAAYLTATLAGVNAAASPVSIRLDILDPDSGQVQETGVVIPLGPLDAISQRVLEAPYVLTFEGEGRTPVSCTVTLAAGDERDFLVLEDRVLVVDPAATSVTAADLDVATSSLCR